MCRCCVPLSLHMLAHPTQLCTWLSPPLKASAHAFRKCSPASPLSVLHPTAGMSRNYRPPVTDCSPSREMPRKHSMIRDFARVSSHACSSGLPSPSSLSLSPSLSPSPLRCCSHGCQFRFRGVFLDSRPHTLEGAAGRSLVGAPSQPYCPATRHVLVFLGMKESLASDPQCLFLSYFIDYAIIVVPIFPLYPAPPFPQAIPTPLFTSTGPTCSIVSCMSSAPSGGLSLRGDGRTFM